MPAAVALAQALTSALLMNVCIVGLNQLYDVEIDKVNKPYLPLASGEMSMRQARPSCCVVEQSSGHPTHHAAISHTCVTLDMLIRCTQYAVAGPLHGVCERRGRRIHRRRQPVLMELHIDYLKSPAASPQGQWVVAVSGALALVLGALSHSPPLMATLAGSLALGIVYSTELPFLRWKRHPVLAAACILAVR